MANNDIYVRLSPEDLELLSDIMEGKASTSDIDGDPKTAKNEKRIEQLVNNTDGILNSKDSQMSALTGIAGLIGGIPGLIISAVVGAISGISDLVGAIGENLWGLAENFRAAIDAGTDNLEKYLGPINTRLYGLNDKVSNWYNEELPNYFTSMSADITEAFNENSYVEQTDILENVYEVVQQGIGYNIEQRAYLKTIADKTVATFNVLNDDLLNLIRLQQSDITEGAMGAQSLVTHFLNSMFKDSSYMNTLYDTVYKAIYQANSQLSGGESVVWTSAIETWLGSLYSVGINADTIGKIATGLNALATGDIKSLSGDSALNVIFARAAAEANLSYASLLREGLGIDDINGIMLGIVKQLQDVSANTSTNVVKAAWTEVLGTKLSDLVAINNLNTDELQTIADTVSSYSYGDAVKELESQVAIMQSEVRTSLSERIAHTMNNMMYSIGSTIANDQEMYGIWAKAQASKAWTDTLPIDFLDLVKNFNTLVTGAQVTNVIGKAISLVQASQKAAEWDLSDEDTEELLEDAEKTPANIGKFLRDYYQTAVTQKGTDNKTNLNPFLWFSAMSGGSMDYQRGSDNIVELLAGIGASETISYSSGISGSSSSSTSIENTIKSAANAAANAVVQEATPSLQQNASNYETPITITSSEGVETTYTLDDIYDALFNEAKSVRVRVVSLTDEVINSLSNVTVEKDMLDKLDTISVDINDIRMNQDNSNVIDILRQMRA